MRAVCVCVRVTPRILSSLLVLCGHIFFQEAEAAADRAAKAAASAAAGAAGAARAASAAGRAAAAEQQATVGTTDMAGVKPGRPTRRWEHGPGGGGGGGGGGGWYVRCSRLRCSSAYRRRRFQTTSFFQGEYRCCRRTNQHRDVEVYRAHAHPRVLFSFSFIV